jgi:hypothetical protein
MFTDKIEHGGHVTLSIADQIKQAQLSQNSRSLFTAAKVKAIRATFPSFTISNRS